MMSTNNFINQVRQIYSELMENVPSRDDGLSICKLISCYGEKLGCSSKNIQEAITWGLKTPSYLGTFRAVQEGRKRADRLFSRQQISEVV